MNVLDESRYKTLTKEFVDLVNGRYGEIPGTISPSLLKKVDKSGITSTDNQFKSIELYKDDFSNFCRDNGLADLSKNETDLLNYILFTKEAKDFYLASQSSNLNEVIGLQEGFGLYVE
jgi:oxaloacetate decarboxylase alpha subunit